MGGADVTLTFPTGAVSPGAYQALLLNAGDTVLSRSPFWLYAAGTSPRVRTAQDVYEVGEPIRVRWRAAPGYRFDWMGVYAPGRGPAQNAEDCNAGSCGNGHYLLYHYTDTRIEGSTLFARILPRVSDVAGEGWELRDPAPDGRRLPPPGDLQLLQVVDASS